METIVAALITGVAGIATAVITALLGHRQGIRSTPARRAASELREKSIELSHGANPNFKELIYPNYGLSLRVPVSWTIEDAPARLASGEFNLIHRYEATKGAIGINFRLRPVQPNYINDIDTQVQNQLDVLRKTDADATVSDKAISGSASKCFAYKIPTARRTMAVRMYWLRLVPTVQLQIQCAHYTDASDAEEFWRNVDNIIDSIVIAFDSWQSREVKGNADL